MVSDSFWTDSYIANLDPTEKLLFLYLLTNPLCNIAGIYEIQVRRIAFDTGIDRDMVEKLLNRFVEDGKLLWVDNWVLLINHAKHQSYKNPNVSKGISRIITDLPEKVKALKGFERLSHFTLLNLTKLNLTATAENDMGGFNKHGDDYLEGSVDYETGEVTPLEEKKKAKSNHPQVYALFEAVLGRHPLNWKVNKTEQEAANNLYTERGLPAVKNALLFYKEHKDKEYCPQITSPYDLDSKWTKLATFKKKLQP